MKLIHPRVRLLSAQENRRTTSWLGSLAVANDRFLIWITNHILASVLLFDLALLVPLLVLLPALKQWQTVVMILSSNWIQLWALFALQRSANRAEEQRAVKADADHEALSYIVAALDELRKR